jgi:hypothetical protein
MSNLAGKSIARSSDPKTSHEAAESASGKADSEIVRLLHASALHKNKGLAPRQILDSLVSLGFDSQSINTRIKKLREAGLIKYKLNKHGFRIERVVLSTGKKGFVHVVGDGRNDVLIDLRPGELKAAQRQDTLERLRSENSHLRKRLVESSIIVSLWNLKYRRRVYPSSPYKEPV